jgi:glycosyltransferase involved in cell wall biosynthesis
MLSMASAELAIPSLSVVVPTFNGAATLRETIDSIVQQSCVTPEIVVIDGGSTDETAEIVAGYGSRIAHFLSEQDEGPYDAMNKGIARAGGEIVAILNSDDRWRPGNIARVLSVFARNPRIEIVHGNVLYHQVDGSSQPIRPTLGLSRWSGLGLPFVHPATFVRRSTYERIGGFDLRYRICADQEFGYRCLRHGVGEFYLDEILVDMKAGGLSTQLDYRGEIREIIASFPAAQRQVASFLWRGLDEEVCYFNGEVDPGLTSAIGKALNCYARRGLQTLKQRRYAGS